MILCATNSLPQLRQATDDPVAISTEVHGTAWLSKEKREGLASVGETGSLHDRFERPIWATGNEPMADVCAGKVMCSMWPWCVTLSCRPSGEISAFVEESTDFNRDTVTEICLIFDRSSAYIVEV